MGKKNAEAIQPTSVPAMASTCSNMPPLLSLTPEQMPGQRKE